MSQDFKALAVNHAKKCEHKQRALEIWLSTLTPFKWLCVGGGTVLPLIAGASLVGKAPFFSEYWEIISAGCLLAAAILTGLHTAFRCDPHQSECLRLITIYELLGEKFRKLSKSSAIEAEQKMAELEQRYDDIAIDAGAKAPLWCRLKAERQLSNA